MKKAIFAGLFVVGFAGVALSYNNVPTSVTVKVPIQNVLCRDGLGQYVSCTPGGNGNLVCSASCGAGSVCLSIDGANHGRCHVSGSREP